MGHWARAPRVYVSYVCAVLTESLEADVDLTLTHTCTHALIYLQYEFSEVAKRHVDIHLGLYA